MVANNIIIRKINQTQYVNYSLIISFSTLAANYFVHVKLMYRFIYSMIMNIAILVFQLVIDYYALNSYLNFVKLCSILLDYYTSYPDNTINNSAEASFICNSNLSYYFYFLAIQGVLVVVKILAILFSFMAHKSLMNKITIKKSDIKFNKLKYH
jgi:hypothetical protein